jgi:phosphohistidine phosphatase
MKSLLIMRHAKSSWKEADLVDHERPLNKRGNKDAPRIGKLLGKERLIPELILTSSARRARDTAEAAADASGYTPEVRHLPELYHPDLETLYEILRMLPADLVRVMVVGHNPELEEFVEALTGESVTLPTAALVHIALPIENWGELHDEIEGKIIQSWFPRELE